MFRLIVVFLGIPLGLFLIIFGGMGVIQEINLSSQGKIVEATITDTQTYTNSNGQDNYEVRYQFTVNGTTYSHANSTGRQNLSVILPDQTANNTLEVIYLPGNPWVNRPTQLQINGKQPYCIHCWFNIFSIGSIHRYIRL